MNTYDKQMAVITKAQERREELLELEKGFQAADVFVNKGYLDMFGSATILPGSSRAIANTQKLRFFRMTKVVFDPKEDVKDKLVSVYSSLYNMSATVAVYLRGMRDSVEFYFACWSEYAAPLAGEILESTLVGNFPGIDLKAYNAGELSALLGTINNDAEGHEMLRGLASVSMVPSVRDKEKKDQFVQGMEKLINTLKGKEYLGVWFNPKFCVNIKT